MKKVDFNKLQAGDLVEVPRTQFAPMRSGWNGWLFSEAVVIRKGVGRKSKRNVVVVEMRTPAGKNSYGTIEATFYAENVFTTPAAKNARRWYFIKQKACGLAMLAITVLTVWATEGDITIAFITVPLGLTCIFSKEMLIMNDYYFTTKERKKNHDTDFRIVRRDR